MHQFVRCQTGSDRECSKYAYRRTPSLSLPLISSIFFAVSNVRSKPKLGKRKSTSVCIRIEFNLYLCMHYFYCEMDLTNYLVTIKTRYQKYLELSEILCRLSNRYCIGIKYIFKKNHQNSSFQQFNDFSTNCNGLST